MINSRDKGRRGELMLSKELQKYGYETRRGQQYSGANGDADVVGLPGVHIECKFVERLSLRDAIKQSIGDARDGEIPVVMHKKSREEWLVTMRLEDWMKLYKEAEEHGGTENVCQDDN